MTENILDTAPLHAALARLMEELTRLSADDPPDRYEKIAKAISAQMKTLGEIETRNARIEDQAARRQYTRYEDFPPPSPEDQARFRERFERLYGEIIDADTEGEALERPHPD